MIKVLREGKLIVIKESDMRKTDLFFDRVDGAEPIPNKSENKTSGEVVRNETSSKDDLRAEYTKVYGKKPFGGWNEDKLQEMIANKK